MDLTLAAVERVALVGHNGAGKSTLLRALAGFGRASGGVLRVPGTDLSAPCPPASLRQLRCRVAHVHQSLHLVGRPTALASVVQARQTTLVCVLHELDLLRRLAYRVAALRQGRVVADGQLTADTPHQLRGLSRCMPGTPPAPPVPQAPRPAAVAHGRTATA